MILEDFIGYANHLGLLSEEISKGTPVASDPPLSHLTYLILSRTGGEALGNTPQAFSMVALVRRFYRLRHGRRADLPFLPPP